MTHKHDSWSQVNLGHEINSLNFEVAQGLNLLFFVWIIGVTRPINTDIGCSWPKKLMKFSYGAIDYHKCYGEFLRDAPKTISENHLARYFQNYVERGTLKGKETFYIIGSYMWGIVYGVLWEFIFSA